MNLSTENKPIEKPILRGHFHQEAFFFAFGACSMLVAQSSGLRSILSTLIYSLSLCGLLGISALYHRVHWSQKARAWMRRLDHAAIFILIAGTSTPICLLALAHEVGVQLLIIVWCAAGLGIVQSLFWVKAPKWLAAILYVLMGWLVVPYLPELSQALGIQQVAYIFVGGILYTTGALIYALKRPNPYPQYFGYHEIFHILVVIAAVFHFLAIYSLVH